MKITQDVMFFGLAPTMTEEQFHLVNEILNPANLITIANAKAGTGKTTLAVACAKLLQKPLVYIFAPVEEHNLGFRPGTQEEKEQAYLQPLMDALAKIGDNPMQAIDPKRGWIIPRSHTFLRGVNFENKTVIIDEAQNFTQAQLRKVLTRIHDSCKTILIGHTGQVDLNPPTHSGFQRYLAHFKDQEFASVVQLTTNFRGKLAAHADLI